MLRRIIERKDVKDNEILKVLTPRTLRLMFLELCPEYHQ